MARVARFKILNNDAWYHLYSRIAGRRDHYPLSEEASSRKLIGTFEHFSSIYFCEVASFSVMGSHYLCEAPHRDRFYTSSDLLEWTSYTLETEDSQYFYDLLWTGERFVAVGNDGSVLISDNGVTWIISSVAGAGDLLGVAYRDGLLVAVGANGELLSSENIGVWHLANEGSTAGIDQLAWNGDTYVAVGWQTRTTNVSPVILASPDARSWQVVPQPGNGNLYDVVWADGLFVAVGAHGTLLTSPDGYSWSLVNVPVSGTLILPLPLSE